MGLPLSAWVNQQIEARHTKAVEFKGIKQSVDELPTRRTGLSEDQIPKVGDLWLVKVEGEDKYDEYICTSTENDRYTWELIGNLTNVGLNDTFWTKAQSDNRYASMVNGQEVSQGEVTINMTDIPDHTDYALSADVDALVDTTKQELTQALATAKSELELRSDANDEGLSALLRDRYEGRDNILSAAIDRIIEELEVELTYKGFTENTLVNSPVDPDWKIGDVKLISSIFETTKDDVTTLTPSVDAYVWTGAPSETNPDARGWKLLGPIQGNILSALFATKDYANAKDEVAVAMVRTEMNTISGNIQAKIDNAVENLEDKIDGSIADISGTIATDYVTYPYLNIEYDNSIKAWVSNQISENVDSLLKFKGIYNSFNEMKQALSETGSRIIGSVYLIPATSDGNSYYEEYVIRKTEYSDSDFELIGTVDINQMSKYLLVTDAANTYETILNCNLLRSRLDKAEADIQYISGQVSTLSSNFESLNTRYNALEYTYSMLSSHIGRTTSYWPNLPTESLASHVSDTMSVNAMNDKLNLYRFDQSFTVISSDFTNLLQDPRYHLPPATTLPLGAVVSYQVRNETDQQRQLDIYIDKENSATPEVISITIPRNSEEMVILCEFKVVFNGTENEWLLMKDKAN